MYETHYHRPKSLAEAAKIFSGNPEARYLGGGMTLIPTMKLRLASPSDVIDLAAIPEMKGISVSGDAVTIGGGVTHYDVANSADVKKAIPALAELAGSIGDPAVRYRGTIGGSLANNDPSADYPSAALALGATIKTNQRSIPADSFFTGIFSTALKDGEIITQVSFPIPTKAGYRKFLNPASRYAMAGVFVVRTKDGKVRVAVTGAGNTGVYRASDMEAALEKKFAADAISGIAVDKSKMLTDIHASSEYRANLVKVMATRAVAAIA